MSLKKNVGVATLVAAQLCIVVMAVVSLPFPQAAEATLSCTDIALKLTPCVDYLQKGGTPPFSCCNGVKAVNDSAKTTPERQSTCECLKSLAKSLPDFKEENAAKLPDLCGVKVPYPISLKTDCSKVK